MVALIQPAPAADKVDYREALQPFNDFIGQWKGDGKNTAKKKSWVEDMEWGWKFKGDEAWLILKIKDGEFLKSGELRYMPDKKNFKLQLVDHADKKMEFVGEMKKNTLIMEFEDKDAKETQKLEMFNAGDGVFLNYKLSKKAAGRPTFTTVAEVKAKREGVTFGPGQKKNICVVSGGLGTAAVEYKGRTFYICCSGCRDAWNESDAARDKFVKEFDAKTKK